jgi:hypothetical protein
MTAQVQEAADAAELLAAEVRAQMARRKVTVSALHAAAAVGYPFGEPPSRSKIYRMVNGAYPFDPLFLAFVAEQLGVARDELMRPVIDAVVEPEARARFRCTQPSSDPALPAQLRRRGAALERYTGPLRRASDCVA